MPTLASELRNKLERVVIDARDAAEAGARAALEALAVHHHEPYAHMKPPDRELRMHLRARARQLGDRQDAAGRLGIDHLAGECAYEYWHRMLFARFLAENNLLIEPEDDMAISLAEAEELAEEEGVDVWVYASRCAQGMLPQIFRPDDPLLQLSFATEHRIKLEKLLASLPSAVFTASDALGWVYQFWQSKRKDEVNRSEVKIGADEIAAVTQLFTEPYMVEFLLHNTLGAWWAGKRLTSRDREEAESEVELRKKLALPGVAWDYLRFVRGDDGDGGDWRPAAGTFDGWPKTAAELRVLDPCCGSGHFLVAALHHLVPIRMAEEGLSAADAVDAVLRDNLHGLEIDERCCQIAAFALAFAAWTNPNADGYRQLPELHIACTGIGPQCSAEQWIKLAEQSAIPMPTVGREAIKNGLLNLHRLFSQAPTLGSLINPAQIPSDLIAADYETIQPYLTAIHEAERADDETRERAIAAAGMVKAADLLGREYTLVITNVPYLGRAKQVENLKAYLIEHYSAGKADLATAFLLRCFEFCRKGGSTALVTPQYWLFLASYRKLRELLLARREWASVARLGPGAFETISGEVVNVVLSVISARVPGNEHKFGGVDASIATRPAEKAGILRGEVPASIALVCQAGQVNTPDARIAFDAKTASELLSRYAYCFQGSSMMDMERLRLCFWEVLEHNEMWELHLSSPTGSQPYTGCHYISASHNRADIKELAALLKIEGRLGGWQSGRQLIGKKGVTLAWLGELPASLFPGMAFDHSAAVIIPQNEDNLLPIWCYCSNPSFKEEVRRIDKKPQVANTSFVKVPFDLDYWRKVATEKYPDGLPEPESDDPTQWLFHGYPYEANEDTMLQVAVARLLGYRWPAELDDKMSLSRRAQTLVAKCGEVAKFADNDGIVCIPAIRGEEPAAERLLRLLAACAIEPEGDLDEWLRNRLRPNGQPHFLIEPEGDLDDWLRNRFFDEHCNLFHDRPFVWHIWDGRKRDGFHALVNYHKLCEAGGKGRRLLESLTYAYLGDWITRQKDGVKRGEGGAEDRLAAALELQKRLEAILAGEPPFDIFVRWKPLHEQPIGWEPDINDGVRINIRPFLASDLPGGKKGAGILRAKPNIKWVKDRGKEPERAKAEYPWFWNWDEMSLDFLGTGKEPDGNRWNDCHYTNQVKQAARDAAEND